MQIKEKDFNMVDYANELLSGVNFEEDKVVGNIYPKHAEAIRKVVDYLWDAEQADGVEGFDDDDNPIIVENHIFNGVLVLSQLLDEIDDELDDGYYAKDMQDFSKNF